jgi:NodT family efflux transporter outer membrane factor (OMF) lipoprotein
MRTLQHIRTPYLVLLGLTAFALSACLVGPNYKRPPAATPPAYKEAVGWAQAAPADTLDRGQWWELFGDPDLDRLEVEVAAHNQNLIAAEKAYDQARALVAEARASFYPVVTLTPTFDESGGGGVFQSPVAGAASGAAAAPALRGAQTSSQDPINPAATVIRNIQITLGATWAPDVWGKVRRQVEAASAAAQASAANVANVRLIAQTELASDYLQLRATDEELRLYDQSVSDFQAVLAIFQTQYAIGTAAQNTVDQAAAQLYTAEAEAAALRQSRQQFEHAIAVLAGEPPASFSLPPKPFNSAIPEVPAGVPSALLQRRPDIALAERQMKAANAQIGVAISAYYPNLTLNASYGYEKFLVNGLTLINNSIWSYGASAPEIVFQGGFRHAAVKAAKSFYRETVAAYRQTVLTAFQQVEDELIALRMLEVQEAKYRKSWAAAADVELIEDKQYEIGTASLTDVLIAQENTLAARRTLVVVQGQRLVAAVTLIEALGGGWKASELPKP